MSIELNFPSYRFRRMYTGDTYMGGHVHIPIPQNLREIFLQDRISDCNEDLQEEERTSR